MISTELYNRATAVIGRIIDLKEEDALNLINRECDTDEELKDLVLKLYGKMDSMEKRVGNHGASTESHKHIKHDNSLTSLFIRKWWADVFNNKNSRLLFLTLILIFLFLFGFLMRVQMRHLLLVDTSQHQYDQLYSQHLRMQEWISQTKKNIEAMASDPVIVHIARECDSLRRIDPSLELLIAQNLEETYINRFKQSSNFHRIPSGIISSEGARILAALYTQSHVDSVVGIRLGQALYDAYIAGMEKTIFVKPLSGSETIYQLPDTTNREVSCIYFTPIRDSVGNLYGVLYNTFRANDEFSKILSRVHFGKEGETYAFDIEGRMLSSGRFLDEIKSIPYFNLGENDETIYNVLLKDPGGDVTKGFIPAVPVSKLPYIAPVYDLIEARKSISADEVLYSEPESPYRNYMGKKVIARWMWWEKYNFGIITEVSLKEALGPIKYIDYAFAVFFLIILVLSYLLYTSNVKIFQFGKKIEDYIQLGQYHLGEKIGEGGFGNVYKAEHSLLKTPVAIKLLKQQFNGTDILDRFEKEVKITASLSHPNTIKVFDYGTSDDGQFYYVMEYLKGVALDQLVQKEGKIEVARGIHILLDVCSSLQEAHKKGLIHRDIKPGNVMVCNMGGAYDFVKLLDFGLVKKINTIKADQTQLNRIGGTPMFMAPERIRDPFNTDQRVDIYSIGALGVYMFSGKYLLELVSQKMLSGEQTLQGDIKAQLIDNDVVPQKLKDMLIKCLSFEPESRPGKIEDLIDLFEACRKELPWTQKDAEKWWREYDMYSL